MARSRSQILNEMRRAQRQAVNKINQEINRVNRHNKQVVDKHNREIDRVNRHNKQVVDKYNRDVRAHNARVKANQQRVRNEWAKLLRQSNSTRYTVYRTSVQDLHSRYVELDRAAEAETHSETYDRIVDLSEREVANSLAVTNALLDENNQEEIPDQLEDAILTDELARISPDLNDRWGGAKFALSSISQNPEASRHFCTSAREIFIRILDIKAPDAEVLALLPGETVPDKDDTPTRKAKIRFCLHRKGIISDALEEFVDENVKNVLSLFRVLNDGTHGSSGKFSFVQLTKIRKRVEDGILYLAQIVS